MGDSSFGRLVAVLLSPEQTFEAIRERPTVLLALVVLVILSLASGLLLTQKMDMDEVVREAIAQGGRQVSEEQIEQGVEMQEKFGWLFAILGSVVFLPAGYLLVALVLWVVFKLLGGELPYKSSLSTTVHAMMPTAVAGLISLPIILTRSEVSYDDIKTGSVLASNLGVLAGEETGTAVRTLLASVDLFSLWTVALLAVGFAVVARTSRATAGFTVGGLWVVWVLIKVGWVSIFS